MLKITFKKYLHQKTEGNVSRRHYRVRGCRHVRRAESRDVPREEEKPGDQSGVLVKESRRGNLLPVMKKTNGIS